MTLAWIYSVCIIIKSIVYEKEQRLKEVRQILLQINPFYLKVHRISRWV